MYEHWFEKLSHQLDIENVKQTKNSIELILNPKKMKLIDGEKLFLKASELSRSIRFSSRFSRLVITLDIVHLDKHYIIELLEILEKCQS